MGVGNFFGMLPEKMRNSRLYGVELDPVSGRIAKQLYPKADITVGGFETTDRRDFFDLAIGNVPFGQYQVNDKAYNKLNFNIHNYFFAKALDQVRPGGVVAFVTSRYTWMPRIPPCAAILPSVLSCWELSVCRMTRSKRMPVPRWYRTSSSSKSGTARWTFTRVDADRTNGGWVCHQPVFYRPPGNGAGQTGAGKHCSWYGLHREPHRGTGAFRPDA